MREMSNRARIITAALLLSLGAIMYFVLNALNCNSVIFDDMFFVFSVTACLLLALALKAHISSQHYRDFSALFCGPFNIYFKRRSFSRRFLSQQSKKLCAVFEITKILFTHRRKNLDVFSVRFQYKIAVAVGHISYYYIFHFKCPRIHQTNYRFSYQSVLCPKRKAG